MAITILEALQNANYNLQNSGRAGFPVAIAKAQIHNAVTLLEKGYDLHDYVDPLLDEYENVEDVPEKSKAPTGDVLKTHTISPKT